MNTINLKLLYGILTVLQMFFIIIFFYVPRSLPVIQTPLNWLINSSGMHDRFFKHSSVSMAATLDIVSYFGKIISWTLVMATLIRMAFVLSLKDTQTLQKSEINRILRLSAWIIVGSVIAGFSSMNLHATILILPALMIEIILDGLLTSSIFKTSITAIITVVASLVVGLLVNIIAVYVKYK